MKRLRLKFVRWLVLLMAACSLGNNLYGQEDASEKNIPNIIIMTFSGVRNSETIEDKTHQYIPYLWGQIFKEGVLYTNLVALNYQFHMPAVQAINTGLTYPVFSKPLLAPSIFQYVSKKYHWPQTKLWSVGAWFKSDYALATVDYPQETFPCWLNLIFYSMSAQLKEILNKQELSFGNSFLALMEENPEWWPNWDSLGDVQFKMFADILRKFKPKLIHYIFNDTEAAHSDTFARYVLALKKCDREISEIKEFIDQDPYYKNNTYLFISVDHERDAYYIDHYENAYSNPAHVWMCVYGPQIKKGRVINRPVYHTDIFATVAYLMGVETHTHDGKILKDSFK